MKQIIETWVFIVLFLGLGVWFAMELPNFLIDSKTIEQSLTLTIKQ